MSSIKKKLSSFPDHLLSRLQNSFLRSRQLQQIHAQTLTNTSLQSNALVLLFLSSCARSRKLHYALHYLHTLPTPDSFLWNSLVRFSVESTSDESFLFYYKRMVFENVVPDTATFSMIIRECAALCLVIVGENVHCQILKMGCGFDRFLETGLLDFYGKVGDLKSAKRVFYEMPDRDVITHNAMIAVLSKHGFVAEARGLFDEMTEKSSASWNTMISCYCKWGDIDSARAIFDRNPIKDLVSWNAMIDGYCKTGRLLQAGELFDKMGSARNSVTWNTMITGCVQGREFARAISMFQQMQVEKVRPTEVTMVSLLSACAHLGALDMGIWIHTYVRHHNLRVDVVLGNALIDMYYKCGSIKTALEVFHGLSRRNVYCWNSIIVGLGMHGYGRDAVEAFVAMAKERIRPDGVTFVGLLSGCSHSGLILEGRHYFSQMHRAYGIEPRIEHYGCMVDLLGRAGYLAEAIELIGTMPMKPNSVVWGSLFRSCKIHRDIKLSEQVTKSLLELDPRDAGNYVFMSNFYASMNRWDDVEICRKMMIEKGVRKTPGCSSIEVNNVAHEFIVGDTSHPQYVRIIEFLDEISQRLRDLGHEADTKSVLHDIEEEEKENAVRYHSEKIAIAFGIMSIGQGKPIRVVKNLRICSDCHSAAKLMAKLFSREIIVRDRNRFHHFRDGSCSCKDYW